MSPSERTGRAVALTTFVAGQLFLGLLCPAPALCTSIVAVRTADRIIIGADALESFSVNFAAPVAHRSGCKIRAHGAVLFAAAGRIVVNGFSALDFIDSGLNAPKPVLQRIAEINEGLRAYWLDRSIKIKNSNPSLLDAMVSTPLLKTVFAFFDGGVPVLLVTDFSAHADPDGAISVNLRERSCPGTCRPALPYTIALGATKVLFDAILAARLIPSANLPRHVEDMVSREIDAEPEDVGPPISTIILEASGPHWYEDHHGACPAELK